MLVVFLDTILPLGIAGYLVWVVAYMIGSVGACERAGRCRVRHRMTYCPLDPRYRKRGNC